MDESDANSSHSTHRSALSSDCQADFEENEEIVEVLATNVLVSFMY